MKLRAFGPPLLAAAALTAAVTVRLGAQPLAEVPPTPPRPDPRLVGVAGCAAAGCHNDQKRVGSPGSEYGSWVHDPHGRAYETVQSPKYRAILQRLTGTAYTEDLCLKCHATPTADGSPLPRELLAEGIGCEACHGASERWRTVHFQTPWKSLTDDQKWQEYGLYPNRDIARRVEKCAECHVGTADKDVNHDLIAAGHPRLAFEYTAYHHLLPRHWREPHEQTPPGPGAHPDFDVYAWAIGQAVTAQTTVSLLAGRAERANQPTHPWPEFSEYGCYACHHALAPEGDGPASWRQKRGFVGTPGDWPWGTWIRPGVEMLAKSVAEPNDPFAELSALMHRTVPAPDQVRATSKLTFDRLNGWLTRLRRAEPLSAGQVRDRLNALIADGLAHPPRDWDAAAQHYLALAALATALGELDPAVVTPQRQALFTDLRKPLTFPAGRGGSFDSPVDFRPEAYRQALERVRSAWEGGSAP